MIAPLSFHIVRAQLARALAFLLMVLGLLMVPSALAGDRPAPDTFILTAPDLVTTSTTATFTFESTVPRAEFYCVLDDEPETPCHTATWEREGLAPGDHTFWVYSVNMDNGVRDEEPAEWEWRIEVEPAPDAGGPDGGTTGGDAGTADGGTSGGDAGTADGGTSGGDAGTADGGTSGGDAGTADGGSTGGGDAGPADGGPTGGGDAGTPAGDGGSTSEDAGTPGDGGASPGNDAGTAGGDGGAPDEGDAGTPDGGADDAGDEGNPVSPDALDYLGGGVGCTGAPAPGAVVAGLLLLALALHRRRRR
ncbi:MYXO-CTERM sorting domain-containing protein [Pyxidicoccus xibeiensis]|uniref:MYXO-CTERM sorting domain-containing protein n=1 Tax=Pyxidicoccus xibeiensis TaxID=2906759 RepID=UPI0020A8213D|nr:MYXO-CTERM sorting domain-containing protein [Pyxidicoccus xibeiensis]MCP3139963.1 MYXO-CTERM sorting domain-containing protein [Pyxidicoccus xibeiensis]